jgi:tricorn protease
VLKLWHVESGEITQLTQPVLEDTMPAFDPQGRYLYFLSQRIFNPMYDALHFELSFPRGQKPYLITLRKELESPFIPKPPSEEALEEKESKDQPEKDADTTADGQPDEKDQTKLAEEAEEKAPPKIQIDLENIQERIIAFPVQEGLYRRILGTQDGKVLYSRYPPHGALEQVTDLEALQLDGSVLCYNFEEQKEETLYTDVSNFNYPPMVG